MNSQPGATPPPTRPFLGVEVEGSGLSFTPTSFVLREGLSQLYQATIRGFAVGGSSTRRAWLGRPVTLTYRSTVEEARGGVTRNVHGVIRSFATRGRQGRSGDDHVLAEMVLVPRMALLTSRFTSRIFERSSVQTIVDTILGEWGVPSRWALDSERSPWEYCVQYQESDFDFVARILGAEGIYFYFEEAHDAGPERVRVVLTDKPIAAGGEPQQLVFGPHGSTEGRTTDRAFELAERHSLSTAAVSLRDYDAGHANVDWALSASRWTGGGKADEEPFADLRTRYEFRPAKTFDMKQAAGTTALDQSRRDARVYEGSCASTALGAASIFVISQHTDPDLDGSYLVTELETTGRDPRWEPSHEAEQSSFHQLVTALRAEDRFRPVRPNHVRHHGLDTGVVVGPPGAPVHADSQGRVRVRLHWQGPVSSAVDASAEGNAAWLRVTQPWNNPGSGVQFLPRVGAEVLVGYLGGDVNRPVVLGSLPNSSAPSPFTVPTEVGHSGIVTKSLHDEGHSSLVFDDTTGREAIRVSSHGAIELRSNNAMSVHVGTDERSVIEGRSELTVGADRHERVEGDRSTTVVGAASFNALAGAKLDIQRGAELRAQAIDAAVTETAELTFHGGVEVRADATFSLDVRGRMTQRFRDSLLVTVGEPAEKVTHLVRTEGSMTHESTDVLTLSSHTAIELRCGNSVLWVRPDSIEMRTPKLRADATVIEEVAKNIQLEAQQMVRVAGDRVFALSSAASLGLTSIARLDGPKVALGSPPDPTDGPAARKDEPPPTRVALRDQQGRPVCGERFIVQLADGTTRAGVTNKEGVAEIAGLRGSATIDFIDLSQWERS